MSDKGPTPGEWNGHSAKEWSLALQSLTPGGSEFACDPKECVDYVRRVFSDQSATRLELARTRRFIAEMLSPILRTIERQAEVLSRRNGDTRPAETILHELSKLKLSTFESRLSSLASEEAAAEGRE